MHCGSREGLRKNSSRPLPSQKRICCSASSQPTCAACRRNCEPSRKTRKIPLKYRTWLTPGRSGIILAARVESIPTDAIRTVGLRSVFPYLCLGAKPACLRFSHLGFPLNGACLRGRARGFWLYFGNSGFGFGGQGQYGSYWQWRT